MEIKFEDATFGYRSRDLRVLEDFHLSIESGRTILLGPNGAGKSTLLAIAASVLPLGRGRGRVSIDGLAPTTGRDRAEYRRRVAWMPQTVRAASGVSVRQQVALHGWLAGLDKARAWNEASSALERVDLSELADRRATKLSGGQRARMGLAQALVHAADVFLLDEPTAALDPDQKDSFAALLNTISTDKIVVVSSHDVSDLEASYDRVVVLDKGQVRFAGSTTEFLRSEDRDLSAVEAYRAALGAK